MSEYSVGDKALCLCTCYNLNKKPHKKCDRYRISGLVKYGAYTVRKVRSTGNGIVVKTDDGMVCCSERRFKKVEDIDRRPPPPPTTPLRPINPVKRIVIEEESDFTG